jgi:hypothetical protein
MKKIVILIALLLVSGFAWAEDKDEAAGNTADTAAAVDTAGNTAVAEVQKEKTVIVYDVYKHMETSNNVFLGISGLSIAMGVGLATTAHKNTIQLGSGIGSVIWGGAETGLYLFNKNFGVKEPDPEKARRNFAEMSGWHSVIDLAIMVGGGCLTMFGNDSIKGYGIAAMVEGAMLATYDGINFFIANNPKDVKNWGAGVGYNLKFAENFKN